MKPLIAILFAWLITSCDSLPIDHPFKGTFNGYVIKRGHNHSNNLTFVPVDSYELKFKVRFLGDVLHTPKDSAIHKVYGMSDYGSVHSNNSLRIGWRMRQDSTIDIFAYWYMDGKLGTKWIGGTTVEKEDVAELKITNDYYVFKFNDKTFSVKRTKNWQVGPRYRLFPYYEDGKGNGTPHEMTFYILEQ